MAIKIRKLILKCISKFSHNLLFVACGVLLSLSAVPIHATFDAEKICALIANGTTIKDPSFCNSWFQCIDGKAVPGTCPKGLFYDKNNNTCVPPKSIECISSNPCAASDGHRGFYPDPYSCNGYYYCTNGSGSRGECSSGLNFNPGTQNCIRDFPCSPKVDPESYCNIIPNGVFIASTESCSSYQLCWKDKLLNGSCPASLYFNAPKGACDAPKNVTCLYNSEVIKPSLPANGICQHADMFVTDNRTCNGYYYCKQSAGDNELTLNWGKCPSKRFFNASADGSCVARTEIRCSFDRCAGLGFKHIELANESDDGCLGYAICQHGSKIGSGLCPRGQYFDEVTQFCTQHAITYPACVKTVKTPSIDTEG